MNLGEILTDSVLDRLRKRAEAATPGPWSWFGNIDMKHIFLGTVHSGRVFVMGFRRWGMQNAQPEFIKPEEDIPKPFGLITPASELAVREVPYRGDIADIDNPDAQFIATFNPAVVSKLLDVVEASKAISHQHGHGSGNPDRSDCPLCRAWEALDE